MENCKKERLEFYDPFELAKYIALENELIFKEQLEQWGYTSDIVGDVVHKDGIVKLVERPSFVPLKGEIPKHLYRCVLTTDLSSLPEWAKNFIEDKLCKNELDIFAIYFDSNNNKLEVYCFPEKEKGSILFDILFMRQFTITGICVNNEQEICETTLFYASTDGFHEYVNFLYSLDFTRWRNGYIENIRELLEEKAFFKEQIQKFQEIRKSDKI